MIIIAVSKFDNLVSETQGIAHFFLSRTRRKGGEAACLLTTELSNFQPQSSQIYKYALHLSPDRQRIEAVKNPRRIETTFPQPTAALVANDTQWLLALRRPDPAPRRNRGKIVALARQLPLPDWSATS